VEERIKVLQEAYTKPEIYLNSEKTKNAQAVEKDLRSELKDLESEYQGRAQ